MSFSNLYYRQIAVLIVIAHTIIFLVQIPQAYFGNQQSANPVEWWVAILRLGLGVYFWGLFTPAILWLGYRLPLTKRQLRNLAVHFAASISLGVVQHYGYTLGTGFFNLASPETVKANLFDLALVFNYVPSSMLRWLAVLAVQQAYLYFQELRERELRLQQAELLSLKSQINPHFLFNALNAIAELVHVSPDAADQAISRLSRLLRISLNGGKTERVALKEELEFVHAYLEIHRILMRQRLRVQWEIEDEIVNAAVPSMILQPLVENSIKHGLAMLAAGGTIKIVAARQNENLCLRIENSGIGLKYRETKDADNSNGGIGLSNTRARLQHLYPARHEFKIEQDASGAVAVVIEIPFDEITAANKNEDSDDYR